MMYNYVKTIDFIFCNLAFNLPLAAKNWSFYDKRISSI